MRIISTFFKLPFIGVVLLALFLSGCPGAMGPKKQGPQNSSQTQFCSAHNSDARTCNLSSVNGKNCVFDTKAKACVFEVPCAPSHGNKDECDAKPGCEYFENWRDKGKNRCLSAREGKGKACDLIAKEEYCELDGYTQEKCVFVHKKCQPLKGFDVDGFNNSGYHLNGTRYNDNGFDWNGIHRDTNSQFDTNNRDREGYDQDGYDVNNRNRGGYDRFGFDINGLNQHRFRADGTHENGTLFDDVGNDVFGFNQLGFNAAGLTINGFDAVGRGRDNLFVSGHAVDGVQEFLGGYGMRRIRLANGLTEDLNYSSRGMDQLHRFNVLPHSPMGGDTRFNLKGLNLAGRDYLGLTAANFAAHGYDAILDQPEVMHNGGGLYPDDLGQLINTFNQKCYKLKYLDPIMYSYEKLNANSFEIAGGDTYSPLVESYRRDSFVETEAASLITRVIKHGNLEDDVRPNNEIKDDFKKYLKKSIYFCDKFLYAGDLKDPHRGRPLPQAFAGLRISQLSGIYADELPQPDYEAYLTAYKHRYGDNDFLAALANTLTTQQVLDGSTYAENGDRNWRGYIHVAGEANHGVLAQDVRSTINVYAPFGGGKDYHLSRLYLYILAQHLPRATIDERQVVAGNFAHGGAHCLDAKRDAVVQSVRHIAPNEIARIESWALQILPDDNLQVAAKKKLYPVKRQKYDEWIRGTLLARHDFEQLSPLSNTWNRYRHRVGLPALENAHPISRDLIFARFFEKAKDVGLYPEYHAVNSNTVTLNGDFTKELIYYILAPKLSDPDSDPFKRIMKEIFGPLWLLDGNPDLVGPSADREVKDHPITKGLLLRLGVLQS